MAVAVCRDMGKVRDGQDSGYILEVKAGGEWVACRDESMVYKVGHEFRGICGCL